MAPSLATFALAAVALSSLQILTADAAVSCVKQLSSCSCRLDNGLEIDLAPLEGFSGPAFTHAAPDGYTYQYNPCKEFICGPEEKNPKEVEAAVCQEKFVIITQYVDFGVQSTAKFDNDPVTGGLRLRYESRDKLKSALISLVCDPSAVDATFSSDGAQQGDTQFVAELRSRYACPVAPRGSAGMSAGDILLIVVFVLLAVYLLGGVLYNRFVRKETGLQMFPNLAFWSSLPGLVADGSAFFYGKCQDLVCRVRGGGTYTDIK